jgi:adenylate cyclase
VPRRIRTLFISFALSLAASAIGIALYLAPLGTLPVADRIGDYIVHQNALAHASAFALPNVPSYEEPNDNLALIEIDELSAAGNSAAGIPPFPFPRSLYGKLLDRLHQAGARVAAFDVEFLENATAPSQDRAFAAGMRKIPTVLANVVGTTTTGQLGVEPPAPDLAPSAAAIGYSSIDTPGGYFIGQPPQIFTAVAITNTSPRSTHTRYSSLAVATLETFTQKPLTDVPLVHGRLLILPIHDTANQAITGRAGAQESSISIAQSVPFVTALTEPVADLRSLVHGKIVLVGSTAQALGDFVTTAGGSIPGLYMNARMIDQLLTKTYIRAVPQWLDIVLIVLLPLVLAFALAELRPNVGILMCIVAIVAYIEFAVAIYAYHLVWLDIIHVAGAMLLATLFAGLYRVTTEGAQRRLVTDTFGMHVSPDVVREILRTEDPRASLQLHGKRVKATIFYSDIRGFTAMSETMTPEEIYGQLNEYFDAMCGIIFRYGGYVDKFIGDCIMAVFSAPFQTPDDATKAIRAAIGQQQLIAEMSRAWEQNGKRAFTVGMGINTGEVVMGNLGASSRMNYTVIGDDVNIAARLYNVAKGGEIIISETTYSEVRGLINVEEMEPVSVKGKSAPLRIYKVLSLKDTVKDTP